MSLVVETPSWSSAHRLAPLYTISKSVHSAINRATTNAPPYQRAGPCTSLIFALLSNYILMTLRQCPLPLHARRTCVCLMYDALVQVYRVFEVRDEGFGCVACCGDAMIDGGGICTDRGRGSGDWKRSWQDHMRRVHIFVYSYSHSLTRILLCLHSHSLMSTTSRRPNIIQGHHDIKPCFFIDFTQFYPGSRHVAENGWSDEGRGTHHSGACHTLMI